MYLTRFTILLMCFVVVIASDENAHSMLNNNVTTYVDVSSQLVKIKNIITVENMLSDPIPSYLYIVDPQWKLNLSFIEAFDEATNSLKINRIHTDETWLKFEIVFNEPLSPGKKEVLHVMSVVINYLQSYPKSVQQNERHLVLFHFNVFFYSLFSTEIQTTYIYLGTSNIMSLDGAKYKSADDSHVFQYGPYSDVTPNSEHISIIHYENTSPFLTVEKLDRSVRISHWGFLSIQEKIWLIHTGPKFSGPFEREFELNSKGSTKDTSIESFVTSLPVDAFDISLNDEIGVVSSFTIDDNHYDKIEVHIRPRFILYGGWKIYYEIGYSLPIVNYVTYDQSTSTFVLSVPLIDKVFPDMVISEAEVTFILPEGGSFQDMYPYYELENNTDNRYCYFFDIICRKVISFKRYNLMEQHAQKVSLTYVYPQLLMLTKPVAIVLFLFLVFVLFSICSSTCCNSNEEKAEQPNAVVNQASEILDKKQKKHQSKSKLKRK
uniref:Dolichyl-diphosphooligosaccharide--protein glycosyltransferase subunit 1 n=1 Tax=Graphocephala atropunctata TaxID=36148 RepID=A0A1B6LMY8_9HEMI